MFLNLFLLTGCEHFETMSNSSGLTNVHYFLVLYNVHSDGTKCRFLFYSKLGGNWTTYINREDGGVYFVSVNNGSHRDTEVNISEQQNGHRQQEIYDTSHSATPRRPSMDSGLGYSPSCDYEVLERNSRYTGSGKKEKPMPRIEEVTDFRRGDCQDKQNYSDQTYSQVLSQKKKEHATREEEITDFRSTNVGDAKYANYLRRDPPIHRTINGSSVNGSHSYSRDTQKHSNNYLGISDHITSVTDQRHETKFVDKSYDQNRHQIFDDCVTHNTPKDRSTYTCSVSDTRSSESQSIIKESHSVQRCKNVYLLPNFKHVCRTTDSGVVLCEKLFGIILCQYNHKTGSSRLGEHNMTNVLKERKVIVQGVAPRSLAEKCGHIHRGLHIICLLSVSGHSILNESVFCSFAG